MKNTHILFNSYEVSEIEETTADFLYRAFGLLPDCNIRYHLNQWSERDGLVFSLDKCPLINYKPCFDPAMSHDPKRYVNGVHQTLLAFVERWNGKFTYFSNGSTLANKMYVMLTFNESQS